MDLAIFALLGAAGFYYLWRFFSQRPESLPTTGPAAGGFGGVDLFVAFLLIAFLLNNTFSSWGHKQVFTVPIILASCFLYLAFIVILLSVLITRYRNPIKIFGLQWTNWQRDIPLCLLALLSLYPIILFVQTLMQKFYGPEVAPQEIVQFLLNSPGLKERSLLIFLAVIMAPLAEETIFRGYIYGVFRQNWGRWAAILINASVFALIHGHIPALPGLFILAVFLSLVYERTGSLWAPIMLHSLFNAVTVVGTLLFPSVQP